MLCWGGGWSGKVLKVFNHSSGYGLNYISPNYKGAPLSGPLEHCITYNKHLEVIVQNSFILL